MVDVTPATSLVLPLAIAAVATVLVAVAELLHFARARRLRTLLFGSRHHSWMILIVASGLRITAAAAIAYSLTLLYLLPEKPRRSGDLADVPYNKLKHVVMVLDVSPSMRLQDAGSEHDLSRMSRAREVLQSFFERVPMREFRITVIATYTKALPVVEATQDVGVINNILTDLPMYFAFSPGETNLFSGIQAAADTARTWRPRSTTVVIVSDGDTVPATGMPRMPASVADVLVVGVGDPTTGSFIGGRNSRQDVSTLRQVATRLGGTYHNGNETHLSTSLIERLTAQMEDDSAGDWDRRDVALLLLLLGSLTLCFVPISLHYFGTTWQPGIRRTQVA